MAHTPTHVEMPAPNLSIDQVLYGVEQGLYREFESHDPGFTLLVNTLMGESVEAVQAFIDNPPNLVSIPPAVRQASDMYLTLKACLECLPPPPAAPDPDPWAQLRADYLERMHAAEAALNAAGGPV